MSKGFKVVTDTEGCNKCGAGKTWTIAGTNDEIAIGYSFGEQEEADDLCEWMNMAYQAGRDDAV